jgi:hypothetical protein
MRDGASRRGNYVARPHTSVFIAALSRRLTELTNSALNLTLYLKEFE